MKKNIIILMLIATVAIIAIIFVVNEKSNEVVFVEEVPTEIIEKIKDWQTYRNEELGFEVQYPEGWFVREYSRYHLVVSFGPGWSKSGGGLWRVVMNENENTLEAELEDFISNQNKYHSVDKSSIKKIEIDGQPAVSFESRTKGTDYYRPATKIFFIRNGKVSGIFEDENATLEYNPNKDNGEKFKKFYESFHFTN